MTSAASAPRLDQRKLPVPRGRWADVVSLLILAALVVAFFWRYLTPDASARILFPDGDFIDQFYPWRYYASFELAQGHLPLWTPFANAGHPFLGNVQVGLLYPPHLVVALLLWLRDNPHLALLEMEWLAVAHVFLAGAFTYLFVKGQTGRALAGLVSGIVFIFGGYVTTYPILQFNLMEVATWAPLVLLLVARAVSRSSSLMWALAGSVLGISTLAGHLQQSAYLYYLTAAFGIFTIFTAASATSSNARPTARSYLPHLAGLALAMIISVGLAAAQLLPGWELISVSSRVAEELSYSFTQGGFSLQEAPGLLLPNSFGGKSLFIGTVPLLLAAVSLWRPRARGSLFWMGVALVAFVLSFGTNLPFYDLAYRAIPGFAWFRDQERIAFVFSLAGAILAGYGIAAIMPRDESGIKACLQGLGMMAAFLALAAVLVVVAAGPLAGLPLPSPFFGPALVPDAGIMAGVAATVAVVIFLAKRGWIGRALAATGLIGLTTAQLFAVNGDNFGPGGRNLFLPTPLTDFLQKLPRDRRIELNHLPYNLGFVFRLPAMWSTSPLVDRYLASALNRPDMWGITHQLLNTGYFVQPDTEQTGPGIFSWDNNVVAAAPYNIAPAYVAFRARVEKDDEAVLDSLARPENASSPDGFVFGRDALLSEELGVTPAGRGYVRSLQTTADDAGNLYLQTDATAPGVLVTSEVYYPGWKAYLDGSETKIVRADYLLRAVALPAGPHVVQMIYEPDSVKVGFAVSTVTLFLVLGLAIVSVRWRWLRKRLVLPILVVGATIAVAVVWASFTPPPKATAAAQLEELSQFLETYYRPGDAVILPTSGLPSQLRLPGGAPYILAGESAALGGHQRLWWLSSLDKPSASAARPGPNEGWQIVDSHWSGNQLLSLLAPTEGILAPAQRRLDALLGDQVALRGYGTSLEKRPSSDQPGSLGVTLYWQAKAALDKDYEDWLGGIHPDRRPLRRE